MQEERQSSTKNHKRETGENTCENLTHVGVGLFDIPVSIWHTCGYLTYLWWEFDIPVGISSIFLSMVIMMCSCFAGASIYSAVFPPSDSEFTTSASITLQIRTMNMEDLQGGPKKHSPVTFFNVTTTQNRSFTTKPVSLRNTMLLMSAVHRLRSGVIRYLTSFGQFDGHSEMEN